jgi:hypothetical protein
MAHPPFDDAADDVLAGAEPAAPNPPRYHLRLMFEWGGGCLWCVNKAAREAFDIDHVEDRLPLSDETRRRLEELSVWHDTALDWDDPGGPSPWAPGEYEDFEQAAGEVLQQVRAELGPDFEVSYRPM